MSIFESFKNWSLGVYRLSRREILNLSFPDGVLLEATPGDSSMRSIESMQKILYLMQRYPARFSFEIWKDNGIRFFFYSFSSNAEGLMKSQLKSVYPEAKIERANSFIPLLKEMDFVSAGTVELTGWELNLRCPADFHYEPLRHLLQTINHFDGKVVFQILFERMGKIPKKKIPAVAHKYKVFGRAPVVKCSIRYAVISPNMEKSREACQQIGHTLSIFDSETSWLVPKIVTYPIMTNSYCLLKRISERRFALFKKQFMISVSELSSMVHLPVGAGDCGVKYSKPSLRFSG